MSVHICSNYRIPDGYVAIEYYPPWIGDSRTPAWRRAKAETVKRRGWDERVLRCRYGKCREPAVVIDHHWPWMSDMNRCEKHKGATP